MGDATIPEMKPAVAALSSCVLQQNSCIAARGKCALGKLNLIAPKPTSTSLPFVSGLKPDKGRISLSSLAIISCLAVCKRLF